MRLTLLNGMRKIGRLIVKDYKKTTATWKGEKPEWDYLISLTAPGPIIVIEPNGGAEGQKKWRFLDKGTKVRFATMTRNFSAKTTVNVIGSRAGTGGLLFVNKKWPRPGIKARNWTKIIIKKWKKRFRRDMEIIMKEMAVVSGHEI